MTVGDDEGSAHRLSDPSGTDRLPSARISALDGLRGLAALAVALGHCNLAVTGPDLWSRTIRDFPAMPADAIVQRLLYVSFPSDAAVTLFFVLSGHVLWESFVRNRTGPRDLPDYLTGRAYRLLPVAIASALPLGFLTNASAGELVANMLLLSTSLNGVLWSLQVEAVCSLAIVVAWLAVGGSRLGLAALLIATLAAAPAFRGSNFFLFFPAFLLGASIGSVPARVWNRRGLFVGGVACLVLASLFLSHSAVSRPFEMLGAVAVIGSTQARPLGLLVSGPVQFLGAISYPFYLCHNTGLILAERIEFLAAPAGPFARIVLLALVSVPIAMAMAWFLHVTVELPSMRVRPRLRVFRRPGPHDASHCATPALEARPREPSATEPTGPR